jgi:hypothetical protein
MDRPHDTADGAVRRLSNSLRAAPFVAQLAGDDAPLGQELSHCSMRMIHRGLLRNG